MTSRKHPLPKVDPDDFGFNVAGKGFRITTRELVMLLGLDTHTCALYMRCFKPFVDRYGAVQQVSNYRFRKTLAVTQAADGGRRLPDSTCARVRRSIDRLREVGLITTRIGTSKRGHRVLKIWLNEPRRK